MIELSDVPRPFRGRRGTVRAPGDVSLSIRAGEFTAAIVLSRRPGGAAAELYELLLADPRIPFQHP